MGDTLRVRKSLFAKKKQKDEEATGEPSAKKQKILNIAATESEVTSALNQWEEEAYINRKGKLKALLAEIEKDQWMYN
eukprot:m.310593 g.310593  ORF g.310593 m.310593 type:complete len:78 (+) comp52894_c0_seq1:65-298(+)